MLGEFGLRDQATRNPVYKEWTDEVLRNGGPGALYWILSDKLDDGSYYPDYDGFTVYCPSPVCTMFSNFADMVLLRGPFTFPPVADHDMVETPFGTPTTVHATANDITYWGVPLRTNKVDLDPTTSGQQTTSTSAAGTFTLLAGGDVAFEPAPDFSGKAYGSYVVPDAWQRLSNVANLTVTVKPDPNAALRLFSFETGTEGWAAPSWGDTAATVQQTSAYATDGSFSLKVDTVAGGWYGLVLAPTPANVAAKTHFKFDIKTNASGTSQNAALQVGDSWSWCQGTAWAWANPDTAVTVDLELATLDCGGATPDYTKVQAIYVWFQAGGTFYLDNVRAE